VALGQLSREGVLSAIEQWRRLGRNAFLEQYGFGEARDWVLRHVGELYDSKAIAGVAYGYDHPDEGPPAPAAFSGGLETIRALEAAGFSVERQVVEGGDPLRATIEQVLAEYADARAHQPYGSASPMWSTFMGLADALGQSAPVASRDTVSPVGSVGAGN